MSKYTGVFPNIKTYTGTGTKYRNYMKMGDSGDEVKKLQSFLNWAINSGLVVDGSFGEKTDTAVRAFQTKCKITVDGLFGATSLEKAKAFDKDIKSTAVKIKGMDISAWQDKITVDNFKKAKAYGIEYVLLRVGYTGSSSKSPTIDSVFENNYKNAISAGLKVGAYYYSLATNTTMAKKEADFVIEKLKGKTISYPVYIDMEDNTYQAKCSKATLASVCNIFCNTIKNAGYIPGVYASLSWFNSKIGTITAEHTKWVAQYYKECQYKGAYDMWQYTSSENVPGIAKNTDVSWCYKDFSKVTKPTPIVEVMESINEIANVQDDICAWAKKIADMKKYTYKKWSSNVKTHQCPLCHPDSGNGWNCIGFAFACWHHGGNIPCNCNCGVVANGIWENILKAKTDKEALELAQKYIGIKEIEVIRNTTKIPTSQLKKGDIVSFFINGTTYQHTALYIGDGLMADSSGGNVGKYVTYGKKIRSGLKVAIRYIGNQKTEDPSSKQNYPNELPTTKLVKTNSEVIADAIKWAIWIASDNSFHYGYTSKDKKINAHHNGCYFCGTNTTSGGRSKKGVVDYEKTYCCNPFVNAAWAHGGCVPKAMELCSKGSSWAFGNGVGYDASSLFTKLGHPAKSKLKAGDVLCRDTHVALYIGNGKIAEAGSGDDNKKGSVKWNNSIHIITLTDSNYAKFPRVYRFNSSVNTTAIIKHGEVSERVKQWQMFLNWYFDGKVGTPDGYYGDNTLKWTKQFQEEAIGKGQGDGLIGKKTLAVAKSIEK